MRLIGHTVRFLYRPAYHDTLRCQALLLATRQMHTHLAPPSICRRGFILMMIFTPGGARKSHAYDTCSDELNTIISITPCTVPRHA